MARRFSIPTQTAWVALLGLIAGAAWLLSSGEIKRADLTVASEVALRGPTGQPQLVSVEALPAMEGPICQWVPASASLSEALQQQTAQTGSARAAGVGTPTAINVDRTPLRVIRDTFPTYSALAVDVKSNEVFLEDENLFGLRVFNRLDNTPPGANFTEPKRMLGGTETKLEFNCGLYIDPNTEDVYSVNNDTIDTMVVFPHDAKGNVLPMRELKTPHRSYAIAVDEQAQELYLTAEFPSAVVVYRKMAQGDEKPIRTLGGDHTRLADPHGIAIDTKNGWMYVSNHGSVSNDKVAGSGRFEPPSISVHPLKASGDTPPIRIIQGAKTLLNWPAAIFLDQERGELYVANDASDSLLVFRATENGDVAPIRVIQGPKTQIKNPTGVFVDVKNDELWLSNMGNHRATVFPRTANGDAAPKRVIRSAPADKLAQMIGNPGAVGYDPKREEILVPN